MHLHWLPIKFRVEFKIALLVYKALNGMAPDYIADLLLEKLDCSYQLRSNDQGLLLTPKTRPKTLGDICARWSVNMEQITITLGILNQLKILNLN